MSDAPPPVIASSGRRDFTGWILLAALFAIVIAGTLSSKKETSTVDVRLANAEPILRSGLTSLYGNDVATRAQGVRMIRGLDKQMGPYIKSDPVAAEIHAACQTLLGHMVGKGDLAAMSNSKDAIDRNASVIYSSPTLTIADAERLSKGLDERGFVGELMTDQALAKAGNKSPLRQLAQVSKEALGMAVMIIALIALLCLVSWVYLVVHWSSGNLRPKGPAARPDTMFDADRFANRAAALLALFLVISNVSFAFFRKSDAGAAEVLLGVGMLVCVPLLFRTRVGGLPLRLRDIGVTREGLGRNALLGLFGFGIEFPIAIALAFVGMGIFSKSNPSHPATVALSTSHDWLTIAATFLLASVVAPFWEETMFRGLLFPALSKLTGRFLWGALISSFFFGALHPQGVSLWLGLMAMACVSCALSYYTGSLVPSMFLHAAHNTTLLVITLLWT